MHSDKLKKLFNYSILKYSRAIFYFETLHDHFQKSALIKLIQTILI